MSHIKIENLSKSYVDRRKRKRSPNNGDVNPHDEIQVLKDINLEFEEGEMVCIVGPSGAGKSSMLRIIAGFDTDYSGQILVSGKPVTKPSSDNIFVFQHNGLLPWMTVWQNVELGLRHMQDIEEKDGIIQEHIEMVELAGFEQYFPYQLSGGMQRRAELARALAANPQLLIMDEPFTGLDFLTHLKMREEVVNMHEFFRKTTLMVTHFIDDAIIMGDRIVVLSEPPTTVKFEKKLDYPRPRDFERDKELGELRDEILFMLGVSNVA